MKSYLSHLECTYCSTSYNADRVMNVCPDCGKPLYARYDLAAARDTFTPKVFQNGRPKNLWRYAEVLPVVNADYRHTLGEGFTPLLRLDRLGKALGLNNLFGKYEGLNPTESFKARGLVMAVNRAAELGQKAVAVPTAGNAGIAMSAYAENCGLPAHVYVPQDVPTKFVDHMKSFGGHVTLVDGLITDCAKYVKEGVAEGRWFDLSTLKEPYRVEGKKTMGYELFEHFNGDLPDVVIYPTGGGTGIVGMWKAFEEMQTLGWIDERRPRMVSVQSAGCAPIVRAYEEGTEFAERWQNAATVADGLRVPGAIGDFLILQSVRESGGTAIAVEDAEIVRAFREFANDQDLLVAPEAAATFAALKIMVEREQIDPNERVVLFLTGSGTKYQHLLGAAGDKYLNQTEAAVH